MCKLVSVQWVWNLNRGSTSATNKKIYNVANQRVRVICPFNGSWRGEERDVIVYVVNLARKQIGANGSTCTLQYLCSPLNDLFLPCPRLSADQSHGGKCGKKIRIPPEI